MKFEEFSDCINWFHPIEERQENEYAWKVNVKDVLKYDEEDKIASVNLDIKNLNSAAETLEHLSPTEIANSIIHKEQKILELIREIQAESLTESLKGED